jgi:hypothetical protein
MTKSDFYRKRKLVFAKSLEKGEDLVATAIDGLVSGETHDALSQDAMDFTLRTGRDDFRVAYRTYAYLEKVPLQLAKVPLFPDRLC